MKTKENIFVAEDPDFAFCYPQTDRVLVCHGEAAVITAIDPKKTVAGKIHLGGGGSCRGR